MKKIFQINTSKHFSFQLKTKNFLLVKRLDDVKDSCQIEYNGQIYEINSKRLKVLYKLGEGNFGEVHLVQLENNPNVIFAIKVSFLLLYLNEKENVFV